MKNAHYSDNLETLPKIWFPKFLVKAKLHRNKYGSANMCLPLEIMKEREHNYGKEADPNR